MQKRHITLACGVAALLGAAIYMTRTGADSRPHVVTTTSVLSSIVADLAGPDLQVSVLVPPGSCPGHFDIKVHHLRLLEESGILLAHGFEEYLPDIRRSVSAPDFEPHLIRIEGGWLTPDGMSALYRQVAAHLANVFPEDADVFESGLSGALGRIAETEALVRSIAEDRGFSGVKILCNAHLGGFLAHLGFETAAVYGRREDLSPAGIRSLIGTGRGEGVRLVVDNMQAGTDTGRKFAAELGVPHLAVSNFPGVLPGAATLYETLLANTKMIETVF